MPLMTTPLACQDRPKILCIDDDPDITRSIEICLRNYDVAVVRECCGRLGVCDIFKIRPDLVITDLRMTEGDGHYLLEQVCGNTKTSHIPVIVLTGQRDSHLPGRMRNLGAAGFLNKPAAHQTLITEIARFLPLREIDWNELDDYK